ncbi:unnamed protein product [Durusdinium trenchii]|uniref:Uncharacterized protein n=1 Tax=Durusdinium trenchii TaxID=1381693 RepID=A0ABP0KPN3_9DINO
MAAVQQHPFLGIRLQAERPRECKEKLTATGFAKEGRSAEAEWTGEAAEHRKMYAAIRLPAEHWRRRFEETQKELLALQHEAIAQQQLFEEEQRQAAAEEAALRMELAKVTGAVTALRELHQAKSRHEQIRSEPCQPSGPSQDTGSNQRSRRPSNAISKPVRTAANASAGRSSELHRRGSMHFSSTTASGTPSRRASVQLGFVHGGPMAPSLIGPIAATPKCNSPGVASTAASSKVSVVQDSIPEVVVQESGYIPQDAWPKHWQPTNFPPASF